MGGLQKFGMMLMWRMQAIGSLYSVSMLTITLTLVVYPFVNWRFYEIFGKIGLDLGTQADVPITAIIFTLIVSTAMIGGFIYDRVLKLWKTSTVVAVERNPYAKNLMQPKEILNWQYFFVPMLKANGYNKEAEFMEKWNNKCLSENHVLRQDVNDIMKWVDKYDLEDPDNVFISGDIRGVIKKAKKA